MSSYQIVGALAGFVLSDFSFTGLQQGLTVGSLAGALLDPPKQPNQFGPRLTDLSVQSATYGAEIPMVHGGMATRCNVFWIEKNQIKETATTKKVKAGGKGSKKKVKITTYSYSATFAIGICEGPISGVRRVWVGSKLIYDANTTDIGALMQSNRQASNFALYLGTNTQVANSRIQADKGIGNVPAYRGLAYIVLYDFPLKDYGNSLQSAEVRVEVVANAAIARTSHLENAHYLPWTPIFLPYSQYSRQVIKDDLIYIIYPLQDPNATASVDVTVYVRPLGNPTASWSVHKRFNLPKTVGTSYFSNCGLTGDVKGFAYRVYPSNDIYIVSVDGVVLKHISRAMYTAGVWVWGGNFPDMVHVDTAYDTVALWYAQPSNAGTGNWFPIVLYSWKEFVFKFYSTFIDRLWYLGVDSYQGILYCNTTFSTPDQNWIEEINLTTGAITRTQTVWFSYGNRQIGIVGINPLRYWTVGNDQTAWYWENYTRHTSVQTRWQPGSFSSFMESLGGSCMYNGVFWSSSFGYPSLNTNYPVHTAVPYYPTQSSGNDTLATVVSKQALRSIVLSAGDIDVTELTDTVYGFRTGVGTIVSNIAPLQAAYQFDIIQSGYKVKFVKRGKASVKTINEIDLGATHDGMPKDMLVVEMIPAQDAPTRVTIKYLNPNREYDISEQAAENPSDFRESTEPVEMPLSLPDSVAMQIADKLLHTYSLEREQYKFSLPPTHNNLEPCDVVTLNVNFGSVVARLTSITYERDGSLVIEAKRNSVGTYTSVAVAESPIDNNPASISMDGTTRFVIADIACINEYFESFGACASMHGYYSGWSGAEIFTSADNWQTYTSAVGMDSAGIIGACITVSSTSAKPSWRVDAETVIKCFLSSPMYSVTYDQMLNGENHFAFGEAGRWEIIAAQSIVLDTDGGYILSNLLRSRAGTEWASSLHTQTDTLISLNDAVFMGLKASDISRLTVYRAATAEVDIENAPEQSFTYTGKNLLPLSCVYINGSRGQVNYFLSTSFI